MANHIKARKPFTIDEELILSAAKDICSELVRQSALQSVVQVPLSTSTKARRIGKIAENVEAQLLARINACITMAHNPG